MINTADLQSEISLLESLILTKKRQLTRLHALEHGFQWEELSDRILVLHDPKERNGWKSCTYLGFRTKSEAEKCLSHIRKYKLAVSVEGPRQAECIVGYKWELKCADLVQAAINNLAQRQPTAA
jgi:hypothetical protein